MAIEEAKAVRVLVAKTIEVIGPNKPQMKTPQEYLSRLYLLAKTLRLNLHYYNNIYYYIIVYYSNYYLLYI